MRFCVARVLRRRAKLLTALHAVLPPISRSLNPLLNPNQGIIRSIQRAFDTPFVARSLRHSDDPGSVRQVALPLRLHRPRIVAQVIVTGIPFPVESKALPNVLAGGLQVDHSGLRRVEVREALRHVDLRGRLLVQTLLRAPSLQVRLVSLLIGIALAPRRSRQHRYHGNGRHWGGQKQRKRREDHLRSNTRVQLEAKSQGFDRSE